MTTASELMSQIRSAGGRIALDGDGLDIEAPEEVLSDDLLEVIRKRKPELLALLRAEAAGEHPEPVESASPAPAKPDPSTPMEPLAAPPEPASSPVQEKAEPVLRARLLAAAEDRGFPAINLPALGLVAGREAWSGLAHRSGGRFLADVIAVLEGRSAPMGSGDGVSRGDGERHAEGDRETIAPSVDGTLRVSEIKVGVRRRQDMGDIPELAASIEEYGLIHPLVVDEDRNLIAGGRRLEAVKLLGWKEIPVRRFGELSGEEKRAIELEENVRRKDLTALERSRRIVEDDEKAEEVLAHDEPKPTGPKGGRPGKPASGRAREDRTGQNRETVRRAKEHVSFADRVPCARPWEQKHCLLVKKAIESLPEKEHEGAFALFGSISVLDSGKLGVNFAENLLEMKPAERADLYRLSKSEDSRKQALALTRLAKQPPMPDPRVVILHEVVRLLEKCRGLFPRDKMNTRFERAVNQMRELQRRMGGRA